VPASDRLAIAHVTPHAWGRPHEVNDFVARVAVEQAAAGHRVFVAGPSQSRTQVRAARQAIRAAESRPETLFDAPGLPRAGGEEGPPVIAVGQGIALPRGPRPRAAAVPVDVSRGLERLLALAPLDVVHVHDPFAPSASSTALRHSRALNVGSFHEPTERILSTQVARPLVEIFFGRLDARTASTRGTAELLERFFPGTYDLVLPGADRAGEDRWPHPGERGERLRIAFCAVEERGALRLFLRALRRLPAELDWEAAIWLTEPVDRPPVMSRALRERVAVCSAADMASEELLAGADVLCAASGGPHAAPRILRQALAAGAVPVASALPVYGEVLADGDAGLLFPPGDPITLAGQLARLGSEPRLAERLRRRGSREARGWGDVAAELDGVYERVVARRHDPDGEAAVRRRIAKRPLIEVDLHMHTDHSPDCATPVDVLLATARERGLGAIAITDHNEISGALEAREQAERDGGPRVIVAEEVKTAEQGEVIGLFIEERIPRGLTMAETIAEIRRQGGLVYVPHPFDRLHSVPDYEHLLEIVEEIDILEVFNPRVALTAFNEEAERFAAKYRIVPGAGSDSHVAQGLGSVRIRIHDFDGPQEFLESMRDADITRKHRNLVYVQALKLVQTGGGRGGRKLPPGARQPPRSRRRTGAQRGSARRRGQGKK
jgi:predicted metal-dependent phosphoesterase TrpH/glycosyltransferase involved in cell wall biosynthesis